MNRELVEKVANELINSPTRNPWVTLAFLCDNQLKNIENAPSYNKLIEEQIEMFQFKDEPLGKVEPWKIECLYSLSSIDFEGNYPYESLWSILDRMYEWTAANDCKYMELLDFTKDHFETNIRLMNVRGELDDGI